VERPRQQLDSRRPALLCCVGAEFKRSPTRFVYCVTRRDAQAIRNHRYEPFLAHPGEADLSADVDFAALKDERGASGTRLHGWARRRPG